MPRLSEVRSRVPSWQPKSTCHLIVRIRRLLPPAPFTTREEWLAQFELPEDDSVDDGAWLCDPDGVGPLLCILKVPEPKTAKNRLHIDVRVPGHGSSDERRVRIKAESERLVQAGGTILDNFDGHHVLMGDPEGNELCVGAASA
jgi:Glyoxalase-like domain